MLRVQQAGILDDVGMFSAADVGMFSTADIERRLNLPAFFGAPPEMYFCTSNFCNNCIVHQGNQETAAQLPV
jgi:hypothetical protein